MVVKKSQRTAEVRLTSSRGGVSKPLVIGIIAAIAILALASLLFFTDVLVGKAISFQTLNVGEAGLAIDQEVNTLTVGESVVFPVKVNLGSQKSSIVSFELNYDAQKVSPDCSKIYDALDNVFNYVDDQNTGLAVIRESSCANGKITFTYGALADQTHLITGQQTVAEITFTALDSVGQANLQFTPNSFKVYDLESMEPKLFVLDVKDGMIEVESEAPQFSCTGTTPDQAQLCSGDDMSLSQNTVKAAVAECGMAKCEYKCNTNYAPNTEGTDCLSSVLPDEETLETPGEPTGIITQGTKITLTDLLPVGDVFATKITATETFTKEVTIYTTLYDANGKVLALKTEKLENGLAQGQDYTASISYPEANVKKKSVIVYDVKQGPSVFGDLQVQKS